MRRIDLVTDCGSCAALCCVATAFDASEDFAFAKAAGTRCQYLTRACACAIHDQRIARGLRGCVAYDCHGAGQRATWAFAAMDKQDRDAAFLVLRGLHELLWSLMEASRLCPPSCGELAAQLSAQLDQLAALAEGEGATLLAVELGPHHAHTHVLLRRVGEALGGRRGAGSLLAISRRPR